MSDLFSVPDSAIKADQGDSPSGTFGVSFGEYDEIGGKFKSDVVDGQSVVYVNNVEGVCCGAVGSAGKVCIKGIAECGVSSHRTKSLKAQVVQGLYIKGGNTDFYLSPNLPKSYLTLAVLEEFLGKTFEDDLEVTKYFDFVRRLSEERGTAVDSFSELEAFNVESEEAVNAKTPAKKARNGVSSSFEAVFDGVKSSYSDVFMESGNHEMLAAVKELFIFASGEQEAARTENYNLSQKLNAVVQQLGAWPSNSVTKPPPSVWLAIADVLAEKLRVDKLEASVAGLGTASLYQNQNPSGIGMVQPPPPPYPPSMGAAANVDRKIQSIISRTRDGFLDLERVITVVKGVGSFRSTQPVPSLRELGEDSAIHDRQIKQVTRDFYALEKKLKASQNSSKGKERVVSMGSHSFETIRDLSAWCDTIFSGAIPFGVFVDVFTVLQRVVSFMDVGHESSLREMDCRRKIQLSPDEAVAIEAFAQPLPKLFRGTSKDPTLHHSYLPGITSKDRWEDDIGLTGVKITISENLETVRSGVQSAIDARLDPSKFSDQLEPLVRELQALAREMLSYSISFIESLSTFMSSTYTRLENSGFTKKSSWELVSKLVHRVFAKDCHAVRSKVSEHLDASHKKSMAVGVLWGTLATHQILREYMAHGIENHPSISSEYVRFLVAHCGLSRLDQLEVKVKKLEEDVKTAVTNSATAKRTADQALTRANEAMREAKKR